LARARVEIGNQVCGYLPKNTANSKWYDVKCEKPIAGNMVKITSETNQYLHVSIVEVHAIGS
jgi:hypothetical protein